MDKIAVLIPCYNEAKTVEKVVTDFKRVLPDATVYVYDNNSTDGTAALAAAAGAVVRHEYQQGKGNVMRRMFREIDAEAYVLVDGDDTYPAEAAPEMVRAVAERQADMVVGDRLSSTYYTQNKRPFHNFGNDLVRFCTNRLFGGRIKDICCAPPPMPVICPCSRSCSKRASSRATMLLPCCSLCSPHTTGRGWRIC